MTFKVDDPVEKKMTWFRNIRAGEPFTPGDISGDYSLQLQMGYCNFLAWRRTYHPTARERLMTKVPFSQARAEGQTIEAKRQPLRGP